MSGRQSGNPDIASTNFGLSSKQFVSKWWPKKLGGTPFEIGARKMMRNGIVRRAGAEDHEQHRVILHEFRQRTKSESATLLSVDEGRKRVLLIAAAILAARKLSQYDEGKRVPATMSAISGAIRWAEKILRDPSRFATANQVANYIGMIPCEHSTGKRQRLGKMTKQGNSLLRYLWTEAAIHAVQEPELKRFYRRKLISFRHSEDGAEFHRAAGQHKTTTQILSEWE
jgi:transposase